MPDYTILLIDYNPRSVDHLKAALEKAGYSVAVATDGLRGIEAFRELKPDLTLVEAMLPKKHGFDVCQELKATEHGKGSPVLILTGVYKGQKYRSQARFQLGCDRYLEKPLSEEDLLRAVRSFLPDVSPGKSEPAPGDDAGHSARETEIITQLDTLFPDTPAAPAFSVDPDNKPDHL